MAFEINWEEGGIYKRFYGFVTAEEFMQSITSLQGDHRFDTIRYSINDFLGVEYFDISEADVTKFAAFGKGAAVTNPRIKIAAITSNQSIISLLNIYASPPLAPFPMEIFPSVEAARKWLGQASASP